MLEHYEELAAGTGVDVSESGEIFEQDFRVYDFVVDNFHALEISCAQRADDDVVMPFWKLGAIVKNETRDCG